MPKELIGKENSKRAQFKPLGNCLNPPSQKGIKNGPQKDQEGII